jgi:hypothetical protein
MTAGARQNGWQRSAARRRPAMSASIRCGVGRRGLAASTKKPCKQALARGLGSSQESGYIVKCKNLVPVATFANPSQVAFCRRANYCSKC